MLIYIYISKDLKFYHYASKQLFYGKTNNKYIYLFFNTILYYIKINFYNNHNIISNH